MPTYIVLINYTQQGIQNVKETPSRIETAKQALQAMGGVLKANYLVMGRYDYVAIIEAPDDETMAKFALSLGARGNVRTETLRAFTEEEYRSIIAALP